MNENNKLIINLKQHEVFMLGLAMSEKDARTMVKLLHIGRTTRSSRIRIKQYLRICKIMHKYGYELTNEL